MLQPGAIFLALWYLSKLPAEFLPTRGTAEGVALKFRSALFCSDVLTMENACHRIFVCVCMLADRELHDNCFSSATWSEISRVPASNLAVLEYCSLNMLGHSLWIPPPTFNAWLSALSRYHSRLAPEQFTTPSGRDSHAVITRQLEHVMSAMARQTTEPVPEPVFISPGEQLLPSPASTPSDSDNDSDIDLDLDGPLREEYVPRRAGSRHSSSSSKYSIDHRPFAFDTRANTAGRHSRHSSSFDVEVKPSPLPGNRTMFPDSGFAHKSWTSIDCSQSSAHHHSSNPFSSSLSRWAAARADHQPTMVRAQWLHA